MDHEEQVDEYQQRRLFDEGGDDEDSDNEHQTSKSKGAVTVQIFIKKTYKMINECDNSTPAIASW